MRIPHARSVTLDGEREDLMIAACAALCRRRFADKTEDTVRLQFLTILCVLLMAVSVNGAPADDATDVFRKYVAAIRVGSVDDALKLVEPVPESSKALLRACVECAIAVEKVNTEMTRQMGPAKPEEDGRSMGQPSDEALKILRGVAAGDTVRVLAADPLDPKESIDVALLVRSEGKWVVAAATVVGINPATRFVEPPPDERERFVKLANALTSAATTVLPRLQKEEFKSPAELQDAMNEEMIRAASK